MVCSAEDTRTGQKVAIKKFSRPFQSAIHAKRTCRYYDLGPNLMVFCMKKKQARLNDNENNISFNRPIETQLHFSYTLYAILLRILQGAQTAA